MQTFARMASGITGLDTILQGGFIQGGSYILQGRPGAGKTILSNQLAFNHIADGGRVLFVTLLAESHERLFQALATLDFFDKDRLGAEIAYVSVFKTLMDEGLDAVVKLLRRETKRHEATLLVFDGLLNARDRADTDFDVKTFVAEVQGQAAFVDCTVLFLTSANLEETSPEHTMVDGVIELSDTLAGVRTIRQLQVRKSRGSYALGGLHKFEISKRGVTVYPRIETLYAEVVEGEVVDPTRISSGVEPLDTMMGGGIPRGSVTLVSGPTGSGKTTLGLHFLGQASPNEPALHFGFFETEQRLRVKAASLSIALPDPASQDLSVIWRSLADNLLDQLGHDLIDAVQAGGIRRLFIDGISGFERAAVHPERIVEFLASLFGKLRAMGVTTLATWELREIAGSTVSAPTDNMSAILDNLVLIRHFDEDHNLERAVSIGKMRESAFDTGARRLSFSAKGFMIGDRMGRSPRDPSSPAAMD